jgi:hypothetical protein
VKAAKNVIDNITVLDNIVHITDFAFNGVNWVIEMQKNKGLDIVLVKLWIF